VAIEGKKKWVHLKLSLKTSSGKKKKKKRRRKIEDVAYSYGGGKRSNDGEESRGTLRKGRENTALGNRMIS